MWKSSTDWQHLCCCYGLHGMRGSSTALGDFDCRTQQHLLAGLT